MCDQRGSVYNCFPTDYNKGGQDRHSEGRKGVTHARVDQRVEILLASTALVAVIALFLRFDLHVKL